MRKSVLIFVVDLCLILTNPGNAQVIQPWLENFDGMEAGTFLPRNSGWKVFQGFPSESKPTVKVVEKFGIEGSKALAVSHGEPFRTDNWGIQFQIPEPCRNGTVWIQCKFKSPRQWAGGFMLDARGPERGAILARIGGQLFENKATGQNELRWHCTWEKPYWRLYTLSELDPERWYTVTMRLDLDRRTYASWIDDQPLAEEAQLSAPGPFSQLHIGFGGLGESAALIDDLLVSSEAPDGFTAPELLPEPADHLIFRFAGLGDPQLGFGGYDADKFRFGLAVDQINRAKSDLSLILGDMVHQNRNEEAYRELDALAKGLHAPHYIRGNHDDLDLFLKYFNDTSNYSVIEQGIRFVVVDAIGNQTGLKDDQLAWIETEFRAAEKANEEIVLALHVSPWQENKKGIGKYNQIGPGRKELRELMKEYKVLLCLSGHYHTGLWHAEEEETHYLVLGGTAIVKGGTFGWCLFEVYPDRIVMYHKPLFFSYEKEGVSKVHGPQDWIPYEMLRKMHPYTQLGPLTIKRHRPVE